MATLFQNRQFVVITKKLWSFSMPDMTYMRIIISIYIPSVSAPLRIPRTRHKMYSMNSIRAIDGMEKILSFQEDIFTLITNVLKILNFYIFEFVV